MLRSMSARLDRLESAPRAEVKSVGPDSGLAEAVASVASYRGGRPGGASTFASRSASAAVSAKEQLRSRVKPTPFPPRRSLGLDDDFDFYSLLLGRNQMYLKHKQRSREAHRRGSKWPAERLWATLRGLQAACRRTYP